MLNCFCNAHVYVFFLLSVCLCAPVHVLVSQSRLFMGTMRDCASLCFEPAWEWSLVGELCAWLDLPSLQLLFTSTIATTHYSSPNSLASHIPSTDNYLPPKYALFPKPVCPFAKTCDISSVFDALGHFSNILRHYNRPIWQGLKRLSHNFLGHFEVYFFMEVIGGAQFLGRCTIN